MFALSTIIICYNASCIHDVIISIVVDLILILYLTNSICMLKHFDAQNPTSLSFWFTFCILFRMQNDRPVTVLHPEQNIVSELKWRTC